MSAGRRILGNTAALYTLQAANYLFPLLVVPFLLRVIGLAHFGAINYAASFVQLAVVATSYSFNYTATQFVTQRRNDQAGLERLYSVVLTLKFGLALASLLGLAVLAITLPTLRGNWPLLGVQLSMLVGEVLFPQWLFAGLQRMAIVTVLNVCSRAASIALMFMLVRRPADYVLAAGLQALHFVVAGLLAQLVAARMLHLRFRIVLDRSEYGPIMRDSTKVFLATLSSNVYARGTMVVLGFFAGHIALGEYAIANRISGLCANFVSPVAESFYPHVCTLWNENPRALRRYYLRLIGFMAGLVACGLILLNLLAPWIVRILGGAPMPKVVLLLRWFSPVILLTSLNLLTNIFTMAMKRYDEMRRFFFVAAILFLVVSFPLTYWLGPVGMVITTLVVETWVCLASFTITWTGTRPTRADDQPAEAV